MNTLYLKTFIEVVNLESFSKAADKLYITQPAVTKQVQSLEKDFGTVLLKRQGRKIIPTQTGKELYIYAVNILNAEDEIYSKFRNENDILSGELTIYASSLPATYLLPDIIAEFSKEYSKIVYNIKKIDSKKVYESIENGLTSFGFIGTSYNKKGIENLCIFNDELIVIAPSNGYKNYKDKAVDINFLLEQNIIIREKGSATLQTFNKALKKFECSINDFNIRAIVEDTEIIKNMVKNGIGISIMSNLAVKKEIEEGSIVPIKIKDIDLTRKLFYLYQKNRYFSKIDKKFKEFIFNKYNY